MLLSDEDMDINIHSVTTDHWPRDQHLRVGDFSDMRKSYSYRDRITADRMFPINPKREIPEILYDKITSDFHEYNDDKRFLLYISTFILPDKQTPGIQNSKISS